MWGTERGPVSVVAVGVSGAERLEPHLPEASVETASSVEGDGRAAAVDAADCLLVDGDRWRGTAGPVPGDDGTPTVAVVDDFGADLFARSADDVAGYLPRSAVSAHPTLAADHLASILAREGSVGPDAGSRVDGVEESAGRRREDPGAEPSVEEYERLLDRVNDGVTVHDPETGEFVDANETYLDRLGYEDLAALRERGVGGVSAGGEYTGERARELVRRVHRTGESETVTWKVETADGETRWVESTLTPATLGGEDRVVSMDRDVTDRRQYERTYREIFDTSAATITLHAPGDPTLRDVNRTLCEMLGYDREELVGADSTFVTADVEGYDADRIEAIHRQAVESDDPVEVEWPLKTSDGETRWIEATLTTADVEGDTYVVSTGREVTEAKRREREYEQIFHGVPSPITVNDPETGELLDVNDALCETLGYDRETVLEKGNEGLGLTEEGFTGERATEIVNRVMESGEPETFEWKLETADGDVRVLEVTGTPAEINGQERYVSLTRDITERRRREREYQEIFDNVNDAIAVFDPDTGEIVTVNRRYHEMVGYDDVETIRELGIEGLSVTEEGYTGERGRELIRRVAETGEPETVEWRAETADGERLWLEATMSPSTVGGERRVLSMLRDVTERKRREREYEQIFEGVTEGIGVFDPETLEILDANGAFVEMLGYEDEATFLEQGVDGLSAADEGYTAELGREIHQRVAETGEPETVEWRGVTRDGDRRWIESTVTPAVIGGEEVTVSINRDVTERRRRDRAVETLQSATERMQTAGTPAAVAEVAVEAASEVFDFPAAVCWFHDEDAERLEPVAATDAARERGLVSPMGADRYEYEAFREGTVASYVPSDHGADNPLESGVVLPLGEHGLIAAGRRPGTPSRADEVITDVAQALAEHATTALDRAERTQAVRESERRFRAIAERVDEIIYLATPDFSELQYVNQAYEDIWERPVGALYDDATEFMEAIDDRDRPGFEADFEAMIEDMERDDLEDSYQFEFRVRQPDGEVRWVSATGYGIELPSGERRFVGIAEDVTERKRREQRLEVFNRVLRHNLRNRVDVIKSHATAVADGHEGDHARRIRSAADDLAAVGDRARDIDRIMSRSAELSETDAADHVRGALDRADAAAEPVDVTTDLPGAAPVTTDAEALRVVVESAVENAVAYADSEVRVGVDDHGEELVVTVDDDGPGIPDGELASIESGTETDLRHGRGLGLWQIKWGVDKLNGQLSFDTDGGTTVRIVVPDRPRRATAT